MNNFGRSRVLGRSVFLGLAGAALLALAGCGNGLAGRVADRQPAPQASVPGQIQPGEAPVPQAAPLPQVMSEPFGPIPMTNGQLPSTAPLPDAVSPTGAALPAPAPGRVRVGLLLPLTGTGQGPNLGRILNDAAELAVFDFADANFSLLPYDTEAAGARAAAEQAVNDGVQLILGPLFARDVPDVAAVARARGINVVSFSSDSTVAGNGAFIMGLPPTQAIDRALEAARAKGAERFAALVSGDTLGSRIEDSFRAKVAALGGTVVRVDRYDPSTEDFTNVVKQVGDFDRRRGAAAPSSEATGRTADQRRRAARMSTTRDVDYDVLVLSESGRKLRLLAPMIPYYDIDPAKVRLIGTPLWEDPSLGTEPGLVGAWFAAPDPALRAAFEQKYRTSYGRTPPRIATLSYDAVGLAAVLARQKVVDFSAPTLMSPDGFAGIDGIFRFGQDGVAQRGLAVMEIQRAGIKVVNPAPTSFTQAATN